LSTRTAAERRHTLETPDHPRPTPTDRVTSGSTGVHNIGGRVRDRIAIQEAIKPESAKPKTAREKAADDWLQWEQGWRDRAAASDTAKRQAQIDRENAEKAAADRKARRVQFAANQLLLDSMYESESATPAEITDVNARVAATQPQSFGDIDLHHVTLLTLRAEGK
jgi:hypothetical protein